MEETLLWQPTLKDIDHSQMSQFLHFINKTYQLAITDYFALHAWSIVYPDLFWQAIWQFMKVIYHHPPDSIFKPGVKMQETKWFEGAYLNFAENLLQFRDDAIALKYRSESGIKQEISYLELYKKVCNLASWLHQRGLVAGDRVAACLPNCIETVVAMLATTSLGGVWTACSPDFGTKGLVDRFSQITPKFLFLYENHCYSGKIYDHSKDNAALIEQLPTVEHTLVFSAGKTLDDLPIAQKPLQFASLPFDHPLYILYSSGTTGKPKCMVHGIGGTLLQHLKELKLHTDLKRQDTIFFYTTCAWMMWHWLISSLAVGATIVLYEGNPFYPKKSTLFDLIDECNIRVFGVGAKLIETAEKFKLSPKNTHQLSQLRTLLTTGSPLLPKSFDYVYKEIKSQLCLSSISGGSDIISCFALGNPNLPVYRGELQCLGLGMDIRIYNETGQEMFDQKGELICATPFPSMPIYFWNDPNGEKYQQAYFQRFPNVWTHGDYAKLTTHGGLIIYGRSDATIKPGGIRIGTGEIYQQIEKFPEVLESLAVGYHRNNGEKIILFVTLAEGKKLTEELINKIKSSIKNNISPHHVPAKIIQAPDLPKTMNGKLVEIAVKKIINQQEISQIEALSNPQSLEFFKTLKLDSST